MKSLTTNVFFGAHVWSENPSERFMHASSNQNAAVRDSVKMRRVIESEPYQHHFGSVFQLTGDQNAKTRYDNTRGGYRITVPYFSATGERCSTLVLDDPNPIDERFNPDALERVADEYRATYSQRGSNPTTYVQIVIMQRLADTDLSGTLKEMKGWEHLCLPSPFNPDKRCVTSIFQDWRSEPGEPLWPERNPRQVLAEKRETLGEYDFAAQEEQEPAPASGAIIKRAWLRFWVPADRPDLLTRLERDIIEHESQITKLPVTVEQMRAGEWLEETIQSWDMAISDKVKNAYYVGQTWGAHGAMRLLLDQRRDRWPFPTVLENVVGMRADWPTVTATIVENKANGEAVLQSLRDVITGLIAFDPGNDGKVNRLHATSPQWEAGNVLLPHPALYPWVKFYVFEVLRFPRSAFADQVDTTSQALIRLRYHSGFDAGDFLKVRRGR
jgi:predicted phage terminase large subunit-like protein